MDLARGFAVPGAVDPVAMEPRDGPGPGTDPAAPARPRRVVHEVTHDHVRPEDLRGLRTDLVSWVRATAGSPAGPALADRLEDIATACYEALANVVDHAYGGDGGAVRLVARLDPAEPPWLEIEVADRGAWRPAPADPGHRGRGLALLAGTADGHDVRYDPDGTRVLLWWHRPP
ncbi:ATP-binding protein [Actinomycetospora sp. CA-101289]|uniref:ATP-binding protein n=1 Tax=Actinomycetospora sp. CA-101289 TaxID=3239893 RepID=UPI003D9732F8